MVDASSFSKRPCWLLSSLSSLCTGDSLNHSFSACLSFTHSLSGMNHISVASPLLAASLQTAEPAHRSAPDCSHVSDSPTPADVGGHPWCVHSSALAGWAPGLHSTGNASGDQPQALGSHKLNNSICWKVSFLPVLSLLTCEMTPLLPSPPGTWFWVKVSNPPCIGTTQFSLYSLICRYALTPLLKGTWIIDW